MSLIISLFMLYEGSIQLKVRKAPSGTCNPGSWLSPAGSVGLAITTMLLANPIRKRKLSEMGKAFSSTLKEKAAAGLVNALGKLLPKRNISVMGVGVKGNMRLSIKVKKNRISTEMETL